MKSYTGLIAVLLSAFMLAIMSCGASQPLPDIDATVEARVERLVQPTYTSLPTYTPAPSPAPEVITKEVPVETVLTDTPTPAKEPTYTGWTHSGISE